MEVRSCVKFKTTNGNGDIYWENKSKPSMLLVEKNENLTFNTGEVISSVELVFYSDLSIGRRAQVILFSFVDKVELQYKENAKQFYYNDWILKRKEVVHIEENDSSLSNFWKEEDKLLFKYAPPKVYKATKLEAPTHFHS